MPAVSPTATGAALVPVISPDNADRLEQIGAVQFEPWDLILALAWSPNGDLLAVAAGNAIYLYAGLDFSPTQTLEVGAWVGGLAFSPDGSLLAAGSRDGEIRIWFRPGAGQPFDPQPATRWTAHKKGVNQVAFSPDGRFLASGGNDAIARVWRLEDGELEQQMIGGTFSIPAIAYQPDGRYLAIVNGEVARLREVETGRIGETLRGIAPLLSLAFSPDGQRIATGNLDNRVEIWDAANGKRLTDLEDSQLDRESPAVFSGQVAYSPDGRLLGATSSDGSIRLWRTDTGLPLVALKGHQRAATCLSFSPDQSRLVSGGLDASVIIWGIP